MGSKPLGSHLPYSQSRPPKVSIINFFLISKYIFNSPLFACRYLSPFKMHSKRCAFPAIVLTVILFLCGVWFGKYWSQLENDGHMSRETVHYVYDKDNNFYRYDRQMPLIFIGGMPRSGTTLMRAILDAHPDVRCGEETRLIPRILSQRNRWLSSRFEAGALREGGVTSEIVDSALAAFILEIMVRHSHPARILCNKDPYNMGSALDLARMFPHSRFLLMIRDGRATVNSIVTRQVTISDFNITDFRDCLTRWNKTIGSMYNQCLRVGKSRCLPVYYEQLVLRPREVIPSILRFLDVRWHDSVMHHEDFINKPEGVRLSVFERSTDQVIKPINLDALTAWANSVPLDVRMEIETLAPMLRRLGYDPNEYPPKYGKPDEEIQRNTDQIKLDEDFWKKREEEVLLATKAPLENVVVSPSTPATKEIKG